MVAGEIEDNKGNTLAEVIGGDGRRYIDSDVNAECLANAHLIAAAPELVEAVEDLLSVLSKFDIDPEAYDRGKYFDLIVKAKGGR